MVEMKNCAQCHTLPSMPYIKARASAINRGMFLFRNEPLTRDFCNSIKIANGPKLRQGLRKVRNKLSRQLIALDVQEKSNTFS